MGSPKGLHLKAVSLELLEDEAFATEQAYTQLLPRTSLKDPVIDEVRAIRNAIHEQTKDMSDEERVAYSRREAQKTSK